MVPPTPNPGLELDSTRLANSDTTVLLIGETGVGKELFADYIHRVSTRWDPLLVKIAPSLGGGTA